MVPTVPFPFATPSTVQVTDPPPGTVGVNCCVWLKVIAAVAGARLIAVFETVTVADAAVLVPAGPPHTSE
jgi:hypothetical protein